MKTETEKDGVLSHYITAWDTNDREREREVRDYMYTNCISKER